MSLSVAIVGLPNVGKSTLFNALLKKQVALSANYPFATIEPNVGSTEVPDPRLPKLAQIVGTDTVKYPLVKFYDIAGLIKGAADGEGLGNKFLAHIRETDAICHVLRAFTDDQVVREGSVNPKQDLATIRTELQLSDLEVLHKQKQPKGVSDPQQRRRWQLIQQFINQLEQGQSLRMLGAWAQKSVKQKRANYSSKTANTDTAHTEKSAVQTQTPAEHRQKLRLAKELNLLTYKPELFVLNVDEAELAQASQLQVKYAQKLSQGSQLESGGSVGADQAEPLTQVLPEQIVVISAKIESELAALSASEQQAYLQELGVEQSGLERLAEVAYQTLGLQSFITAGEKEVRAWTIKQGATAYQAAGAIHTDFQDKFVKAKVVSYADFVACQGWQGAKEQGRVRLEGRDYIMRPDDVVEFMVGG
jgi:hypothetical protein